MDIIAKIFVAENAVCVYRNFSFFNAKGKIFAIVCATLEVAFLAHNIYNSYDGKIVMNRDAIFIISFTTLSRAHSILVILLGLKNADAYEVFNWNMNAAYLQMKACNKIQTSFKKVKMYGMLIISFFIINDTIMIIRFVTDFSPYVSKRSTVEIFIFAVDCVQFIIAEYRYFIELVALIVLINTIRLALHFLNLTLVKASKMLENDDLECEVARDLKVDIDKFETVAYHVSKCSYQLKKNFGIQTAFALFCATVYFITLLYKAFYSIISQKERNRFGSGNTMFLLCNYITVPMLTMLAGQKAHNEADQVVRTLARLQNILLRVRGDGVAELNKTVINLHRLMTVKRIRIEILSDVVLHMPMLPDIIHTVISYTIHFLQFNHIV